MKAKIRKAVKEKAEIVDKKTKEVIKNVKDGIK